MQEDLLEAFRLPLFFVYISMLLSFCVVSGTELGDRVELEFQAFRLQQYEVSGNIIGSKSFRVFYEAVSIDANALRKCTIASWRDLMNRDLDALWKTSVGALLIVLPADYGALSPADRKSFEELELALSTVQTELSVYGVKWTESAAALLADVSSTTSPSSGAAALVQTITANTFQLTSMTTSTVPPSLGYQPKNIIARLGGASHNSPTIAFIAHYDTHSAFPDVGNGADSNGSGMVGLLELLAVLKKFYERPATRPNYHMLFVWSAAGKHNFQGTRAFVEEIHDKYPDDKLELSICLDTIVGDGKSLNIHVSKAPAPGSVVDRFVRHLRFAAPNQSIEVVAKKISLANPQFSWEHERLNVKRLPGITLSSLPAPDEMARRSLMDSSIDTVALARNIRAIAESVLNLVLALPEQPTNKDSRVSSDSSLLSPDAISRDRITQLMSQLASSPRPITNQVATEQTAANIAAIASSYTNTRAQNIHLETSVSPIAVERIVAEKTKPAVFDLLLAGAIAVYLSLFMKVAISAQSILESSVATIRKTIQ